MSCCFFFQAEDGIRDIGVTGVQTCALPISTNDSRSFCCQPQGDMIHFTHTARLPADRRALPATREYWMPREKPPSAVLELPERWQGRRAGRRIADSQANEPQRTLQSIQ